MKKVNLSFLGIALLSVLSSCDPSHDKNRYIGNNSDYVIAVVTYSMDGNGIGKDTFILSAKSKTLISARSYGATMNSGGCPPEFDTLAAYLPDHPNLKVTKNLNVETNWTSSTTGNSIKGYIIDCTSEINNSDIAP